MIDTSYVIKAYEVCAKAIQSRNREEIIDLPTFMWQISQVGAATGAWDAPKTFEYCVEVCDQKPKSDWFDYLDQFVWTPIRSSWSKSDSTPVSYNSTYVKVATNGGGLY